MIVVSVCLPFDALSALLSVSVSFLKSTSSGAAASRQLETLGPKIMENNFAPGFMLKHLVKDMGLASEEAGRNGLKLDILDAVLANCKELEAGGDGDLGTQALIKHYVK